MWRKIISKKLNELKNNIDVLLNGLFDKNKAIEYKNNIFKGKIDIFKLVNKLNDKNIALENRNNILLTKIRNH